MGKPVKKECHKSASTRINASRCSSKTKKMRGEEGKIAFAKGQLLQQLTLASTQPHRPAYQTAAHHASIQRGSFPCSGYHATQAAGGPLLLPRQVYRQGPAKNMGGLAAPCFNQSRSPGVISELQTLVAVAPWQLGLQKPACGQQELRPAADHSSGSQPCGTWQAVPQPCNLQQQQQQQALTLQLQTLHLSSQQEQMPLQVTKQQHQYPYRQQQLQQAVSQQKPGADAAPTGKENNNTAAAGAAAWMPMHRTGCASSCNPDQNGPSLSQLPTVVVYLPPLVDPSPPPLPPPLPPDSPPPLPYSLPLQSPLPPLPPESPLPPLPLGPPPETPLPPLPPGPPPETPLLPPPPPPAAAATGALPSPLPAAAERAAEAGSGLGRALGGLPQSRLFGEQALNECGAVKRALPVSNPAGLCFGRNTPSVTGAAQEHRSISTSQVVCSSEMKVTTRAASATAGCASSGATGSSRQGVSSILHSRVPGEGECIESSATTSSGLSRIAEQKSSTAVGKGQQLRPLEASLSAQYLVQHPTPAGEHESGSDGSGVDDGAPNGRSTPSSSKSRSQKHGSSLLSSVMGPLTRMRSRRGVQQEQQLGEKSVGFLPDPEALMRAIRRSKSRRSNCSKSNSKASSSRTTTTSSSRSTTTSSSCSNSRSGRELEVLADTATSRGTLQNCSIGEEEAGPRESEVVTSLCLIPPPPPPPPADEFSLPHDSARPPLVIPLRPAPQTRLQRTRLPLPAAPAASAASTTVAPPAAAGKMASGETTAGQQNLVQWRVKVKGKETTVPLPPPTLKQPDLVQSSSRPGSGEGACTGAEVAAARAAAAIAVQGEETTVPLPPPILKRPDLVQPYSRPASGERASSGAEVAAARAAAATAIQGLRGEELEDGEIPPVPAPRRLHGSNASIGVVGDTASDLEEGEVRGDEEIEEGELPPSPVQCNQDGRYAGQAAAHAGGTAAPSSAAATSFQAPLDDAAPALLGAAGAGQLRFGSDSSNVRRNDFRQRYSRHVLLELRNAPDSSRDIRQAIQGEGRGWMSQPAEYLKELAGAAAAPARCQCSCTDPPQQHAVKAMSRAAGAGPFPTAAIPPQPTPLVQPRLSPLASFPAVFGQQDQGPRYNMQQLPHWQWQQQRQGSLGSLQQRRSPAASDVAARPRLDLTKRFTAPVLVAFDTNVLLEQEGRKLVMDWAQLVERTGLGMVQLLMPQAVLLELDAQKGNLLLGYSAREAAKLIERLLKMVCLLAGSSSTAINSSNGATTLSPSTNGPSCSSSSSATVYRGQAQHEVMQNNEEKLARAFAKVFGDAQPPADQGYAPSGDGNSWGSPRASVSCMGRMGSWFGGQQGNRGTSNSGYSGVHRRGDGGWSSFGGFAQRQQRQLLRDMQRVLGGGLRGDDGIVDCMLYFQSQGHRVTLVTNDRVLRLRAVNEGVSTADIKDWRGVVAGATAGGSLWG